MGTNLALQIIELQTELKEKPLMGIMWYLRKVDYKRSRG